MDFEYIYSMLLSPAKNSDSLQDWLSQLKEFQLDSIFDTSILGRAYLYRDAISIVDQSENSIKATIEEKSYQMQLTHDDRNVYGSCSCPFDGKCKHLAALILVLVVGKGSL